MTQETQKLTAQVNEKPSLLDWLVLPNSSVSSMEERRQAVLSAGLALAVLLITLIGCILTIKASTANALQTFGIPALMSLVAYILIRTKYPWLGSFLLISTICTAVYLNIIANNLEISISLLFYIPFALIVGSAILSVWPLLIITGLNIAAIVVLTSLGIKMPNNISLIVGLITIFGVTLGYIGNFRKSIEAQQISDLKIINQKSIESRTNIQSIVEQRTGALDRRASRLESAALVARAASEIRELDVLLNTVTKQISERFGFYHVGIFLADENNRLLNLVAASSPGGQKMLSRGHRLTIGREGIVGFTAAQKQPRIAQSVEADAVFLNNPDLPTTRSEMALPLLTQSRLVGVLDIQSEDENAFTTEDMSTLQTMTDQIAMAIDNIRLFEQSRTALQRMETANVENINKVWREKLNGQVIGFTYTPLGIEAINPQHDLGDVEIDNDRVLKIPITIRNKVIGTISLLRNLNESRWTETERDMAEGIATQLGLAIDNARLLEEAQNRALREQTINEFSSLLSQSLDIDILLQKAVREIYRMPQVSQVSLFIGPEQDNFKQ